MSRGCGSVGPHFPPGMGDGPGKGSEALTRPTFHQYRSNYGSGNGIVFRVPLYSVTFRHLARNTVEGSVKKMRVRDDRCC